MVIKVKGKRWYPFLLLCILLGTVSFGWKGIVHPWMEAEEKPGKGAEAEVKPGQMRRAGPTELTGKQRPFEGPQSSQK